MNSEQSRIGFVLRALYVGELFTFFIYFYVAKYVMQHAAAPVENMYLLPEVIILCLFILCTSLGGAYLAFSLFTHPDFYQKGFVKRFTSSQDDNQQFLLAGLFGLYAIALALIHSGIVVLFVFTVAKANSYYYETLVLLPLLFYFVSYPRITKLENIVKQVKILYKQKTSF